MVKIVEETIQKFKDSLSVELIRPDDAGYNGVCKIFALINSKKVDALDKMHLYDARLIMSSHNGRKRRACG